MTIMNYIDIYNLSALTIRTSYKSGAFPSQAARTVLVSSKTTAGVLINHSFISDSLPTAKFELFLTALGP